MEDEDVDKFWYELYGKDTTPVDICRIIWCEVCGCFTLCCPYCGINLCSGGSGDLDGQVNYKDMQCPICSLARTLEFELFTGNKNNIFVAMEEIKEKTVELKRQNQLVGSDK